MIRSGEAEFPHALLPPRPKAEAKRQAAKESEKMSARTLFWSEVGFHHF
ncbi:MAG TPA: hypothetical protein PL093_02755 [Candidatus Pacearchaeota archaeon]|nr:hypothetical protein [Candidatus Pacearchaeota archaeon]HRU21068.1 hypothetical protein [Candidatus Paceibacterota bacterium]